MRRTWPFALALVACSAEPPRDAAVPPPPAPTSAPAPPVVEVVDVDGEITVTEADPPPPPDTRPRIGSVAHITWIFSQPSRSSRQIGYVREGTSVPIVSAKVKGTGCGNGWVEVAPFGFVCRDSTTRDTSDPVWQARAIQVDDRKGVLPYRYALSTNAPMYGRLPTRDEEDKVEGPRGKRPPPEKLGPWASGHEELAEKDTGGIAGKDAVPDVVKGGKNLPVPWGEDTRLVRKWIPQGSMLAFTHAFEANERVWLLSTDLTIVPADRVRRFRPSTFRGVRLDDKVKLPLAWARHDAVKLWKKEGEGFEPTKDELAPRSFVGVTGEPVGKDRLLPTDRAGLFVRESDVAVARLREKLPFGVEPTDKWIEVKIKSGTLVAYEGEKPVYATLQSPGAGGVAGWNQSNAELVKNSTTPLGAYRVTWKTRAAPMSPEPGDPKKFWIADVPDTQYFRPPFAIHTAYWHEDFGMPKSAGCVNVSPLDGRFLFTWSDMTVPDAWQGAGPGKQTGVGTYVVISP